MDTGNGRFAKFNATEKEVKDFMNKVYPVENPTFNSLAKKHGFGRSVFREGEILEIKNSRFRVSKLIRNGLKLDLLPEGAEDAKR